MFSGIVHVTKFDVTGTYVCWYVFLKLSPYHVSSELTHRQVALFFMLYILCLRMSRVPLEASATVSGCHRDKSHASDPVLDKRYIWQGNKTTTAKKIKSYSIMITFMTLYVATMPVYPGLLSVYIHNSFSCEFY
jgi:hypothetical protein